MIRFYAPDIDCSPFLPESDSQHCCRVLRMQTGDEIEIIDGRGYLYRCRIVNAHSKRTEVETLERVALPPVWPCHITVAVAPTKHLDRMEWLVEKLVEIGVDRIVPVRCMRSERKEIKVERLEKIAVSAMKQSLKAVLPVIEEMTPLPRFIESVESGTLRFVAYCEDSVERKLLPDHQRQCLSDPKAISRMRKSVLQSTQALSLSRSATTVSAQRLPLLWHVILSISSTRPFRADVAPWP